MNPWSTANPNWEAQFEAGLPLLPRFPLLEDKSSRFYAQAQKARRMFGRLRLPDVRDSPLLSDSVGEWFVKIVEAMLGSYDEQTNRRMIQEAFIAVPKKNAKSSNAAALMVTALLMNKRPEAEFLLIAPTKEIANIAFRQARGMIRLDPALSVLFHIQNHTRTITRRADGSTMQIKAADTDTITGSKQLGTLIDETHVFAKRANAADVFVEIRGALAARPDGFVFQISTQSKDPPTGVFLTELRNARAVRDGDLELPLLPVLYELPKRFQKTEVWKERKFWSLLNPNLGRSVDEDFLARELMKAERDGPDQLALFASQHFNVEIGVGLVSDHWPGARHWEKNGPAKGEPPLTLATLKDMAAVITAGIDGGGLDDLLGLAIIGRTWEGEDRNGKTVYRWFVWTHAWVHSGVLELRKEIEPKLRELVECGDLTVVDDLSVAYSELCQILAEINSTGKLIKVGVDKWGIKLILDELERHGISQDGSDQVDAVPQGSPMMGTIKSVESKLDSRLITHAAQPLMAWAVGNAKVKVTDTAIMITKAASGVAKIDPLMALFDAAALMMSLNDEHGPSIYNTAARAEGFLVV